MGTGFNHTVFRVPKICGLITSLVSRVKDKKLPSFNEAQERLSRLCPAGQNVPEGLGGSQGLPLGKLLDFAASDSDTMEVICSPSPWRAER